MTEEENRRCCILGGCGCTPGGQAQLAALAEEIDAVGGNSHKIAAHVLEIFGVGPHSARLFELGIDDAITTRPTLPQE